VSGGGSTTYNLERAVFIMPSIAVQRTASITLVHRTYTIDLRVGTIRFVINNGKTCIMYCCFATVSDNDGTHKARAAYTSKFQVINDVEIRIECSRADLYARWSGFAPLLYLGYREWGLTIGVTPIVRPPCLLSF
jgi:hypothetical protein